MRIKYKSLAHPAPLPFRSVVRKPFFSKISLMIIRWMTLSANLMLALAVLVNWMFGNYKDLISISWLGCWIFNSAGMAWPSGGCNTVSSAESALFPPTVKITHSGDNTGTDEAWFTLWLDDGGCCKQTLPLIFKQVIMHRSLHSHQQKVICLFSFFISISFLLFT